MRKNLALDVDVGFFFFCMNFLRQFPSSQKYPDAVQRTKKNLFIIAPIIRVRRFIAIFMRLSHAEMPFLERDEMRLRV